MYALLFQDNMIDIKSALENQIKKFPFLDKKAAVNTFLKLMEQKEENIYITNKAKLIITKNLKKN